MYYARSIVSQITLINSKKRPLLIRCWSDRVSVQRHRAEKTPDFPLYCQFLRNYLKIAIAHARERKAGGSREFRPIIESFIIERRRLWCYRCGTQNYIGEFATPPFLLGCFSCGFLPFLFLCLISFFRSEARPEGPHTIISGLLYQSVELIVIYQSLSFLRFFAFLPIR